MTGRIGLIARDESSLDVRLLHQALAALGQPAAPTEVEAGKAGADTEAKVRALQAQLSIAVDPGVLIDTATEVALEDALRARGFVAARRSFNVSGTVRRPDGSPAKRQKLLAFDVDLRGVRVYGAVKTLRELERNGGFDYLGPTTSDAAGAYRLTFYDWQYRRAERKTAHVVVYAVAPDKDRRLIGHSRIASAEDYSAEGLVQGLDVIVEPAAGTEYQALMEPLNAFLAESDVALSEVASSDDALRFTARELDVPEERVRIAAAAAALGAQHESLSPELLYGIGRAGVALEWPVLFAQSDADLRAAITASSAQRIIARLDKKVLTQFLQALHRQSVDSVLDDDAPGSAPLKAMLAPALPQEQQHAFLDAVKTFGGSDFREFWSEYLPQETQLDDETTQKVLHAQRLGVLTGGNDKLLAALQDGGGAATPQVLLALDRERWLDLVRETGVPDFVPGESDDERAANYVDGIRRTLDAAFPTLRIARMVTDGDIEIERKRVARSLQGFLNETPKFDFATSRVHDYDDEIRAVAGEEFDEVRGELLKLQRIFQISPNPDAMVALS